MPIASGPGVEPWRVTLALMSDALPDLARRIGEVEARVGDLAAAAPPDAAARVALQDLDLIRQTVADLARLAGAALSGADLRPDVLSQVLLLSSLRMRVADGGSPRAGPSLADRGTVDLFAPQDPGGGGGRTGGG